MVARICDFRGMQRSRSMSGTAPGAPATAQAYDVDLRRLQHGGRYVQDDFYTCTDSYAAYIGGRGTGKTTTLVYDAVSYAEDYPGSIQVLTEPSFPMLVDVLLPTLERLYGGKRGGPIDWNESSPINVTLANGSAIWLRAGDSVDEDMRRGPNLARTLMDEATLGQQEETFNVLHAANRDLRFPIRQTKLTGTPKGRNWVWRRFIGERMSRARVFVAETKDAEEAGFVPAGYAQELADQYGGWDSPLARQELGAQFLEMAGQVFPQFARDTHIRELEGPDAWRLLKSRYGGIDFGTVSPTALVAVGLDAGGRARAYREWYHHEATLEQTMAAMADLRETAGIEEWVADPAGKHEIEALRTAGFNVRPARHGNRIQVRYQLVGARLNVHAALKLPGMYITPSCPNLITELETLNWRRVKLHGKDEEEMSDQAGFERGAPDHAFDALANVLAEYDAAPEP